MIGQAHIGPAPAYQAAPAPAQQRPWLLQRKCDCGDAAGIGDECAECRSRRLQRSSVRQSSSSAVPDIVHDALQSSAEPLDAHTRAFMERRFGHDFGAVRVHSDARAAESARAVNALAYTVGHDLVFDTGHYAPASSGGRELLAHELAHVVQQSAMTPSAGFVVDTETDSPLEIEARRTAQSVMTESAPAGDAAGPVSANTPGPDRGQSFTPMRAPALQRQEDPELPPPIHMPAPAPAPPAPLQAPPAPFVDLHADPSCPKAPTGLGSVPPDPPCPPPEEEIDGKHFEFCVDSDVLRDPHDRPRLIAFALSRPSSANFVVHGFASKEGGDSYNLNLSCHRAKRIAREMMGAGVRSERIKIAAVGATSQFSTGASPLQANRVAIVQAIAPAAEPDVTPLPEDPRSIVSLAVGKITRGEYRLAADAYLSYWSCGMVPRFAEAMRRTTILIEGEPGVPAIDHTQPNAELGVVLQTGVNTILLAKDTFDAANSLECVMSRIMDMSFHHMVSGQIPPHERHIAGLYDVELAGLAPCRTKPQEFDPAHDMWAPVTLDPRQGVIPPCAPGQVQGPMVTGAGRSKRPVPTFTVIEADTRFIGSVGNSLWKTQGIVGSLASSPGAMRAEAQVQLTGDPATFQDYEIGYIQTGVEEERTFDYVSGHQIQHAPSLPMRDGAPTSVGGRPPWFDPMFVVRADATGSAAVTFSDSPGFRMPLQYLDLEHSKLPTGQGDPVSLVSTSADVLNRAQRHIVFHLWLVARRVDAPLDRLSTHFLKGVVFDFTQDIDLVGSKASGEFVAKHSPLTDTSQMQFTDPVLGDVENFPRLEETFTKPTPRDAAGGLSLPDYHDAVRRLSEPIRREIGLLAPITPSVKIVPDTGRVALDVPGHPAVTTVAGEEAVAQPLLDKFSQRLLEVVRKDLVLAPLSGRLASLTHVPTVLRRLAP